MFLSPSDIPPIDLLPVRVITDLKTIAEYLVHAPGEGHTGVRCSINYGMNRCLIEWYVTVSLRCDERLLSAALQHSG